MLPNTIQIVGVVKKDAFASPGGKFAAANVEVECGRDRAWLDVVAFNGMSEQVAALKEGDKVEITATPQSNKSPKDNVWRLRFVAGEIKKARK